jgi:hypothetical protein
MCENRFDTTGKFETNISDSLYVTPYTYLSLFHQRGYTHVLMEAL